MRVEADERRKEFLTKIARLREEVRIMKESSRSCQVAAGSAEQIIQEISSFDIDTLIPPDVYLVITDGNREFVEKEKVEEIWQNLPADFILDRAARCLWVKKGDRHQKFELAPGKVYWGLEKVLYVGMARPGTPFGHRDALRQFPKDLGVGTVGTLRRYVCKIRNMLGDSGKDNKILRTVTIDRTSSETGIGYVFDSNWSYIVIEKEKYFNQRQEN